MLAIIRHMTSGEHFLAEINEDGDATKLSAPLPASEARNANGEYD